MKIINSALVAFALGAPSANADQAAARGPSIYAIALSAGLKEIIAKWGNINDDVLGTRVPTDWHNVVVERDLDITNEMPAIIDDSRVQYLDWEELTQRYKKLRKPYSIMKVRPMKTEGARLRITFTIYWLSVERRALRYGLSDWCSVYFRYNCEKAQFVVDEVHLGGI